MLSSSRSISPGGRLLLALAFTLLPIAAVPAQEILHEDFEFEILYEVPEVEHPTVVAFDDEGSLFIGEDPMDMRGPATEEFDRILRVSFDSEGKPVRKTIFAEGLSAVFGMIWHDGSLYVLHAPHYTMFRDEDGDGVAELRKDLAEGFGPPAGIYGFNDHIVTGTQLGMDGFVYVSVGDKGIQKATGSDGTSITLEGGGVVRMRLDGSHLEVFSTGTRNHLDVPMDSLDNIFTYDNTDDGLGWWTRFTHHIPTGYYGYPYDYHPHAERHLPHISEHGGGSPVGGECYTGAAWPEKYRDAVFFCEWGKRKLQVFSPRRSGASFEAEMEDFMVPTSGDDFRPQDLCFSPDGRSMIVADWQFDGWTNPKIAGRIYRVFYKGELASEPPRSSDEAPIEVQVKSLSHPARHERMRAQWELARRGEEALSPVKALLKDDAAPKMGKVHALWTLAEISRNLDSYDPSEDLIAALADSDGDVRTQAARALGTLRVQGALNPLIAALKDSEPTVRLQAAVGLGRLGTSEAAEPLFDTLDDEDLFVRFSVIQALRAIDSWEGAVDAVTGENTVRRDAALIALAGEYDAGAVEVLSTLAQSHEEPEIRGNALALLAEVHRKSDPYTEGWWGTRPAAGKPARPKVHDWEGTEAVLAAIRQSLHDAHPTVRLSALRSLETVGESADPELLRTLIREDADQGVRIEAMRRVAGMGDKNSTDLISGIARSSTESVEVRIEALRTLAAFDPRGNAAVFDEAAASVDAATPILIAALEGIALTKDYNQRQPALRHLVHTASQVRAAAVVALGEVTARGASPSLIPVLSDPNVEVRLAVIRTLAKIGAADAVPHLIPLVGDNDVRLEIYRALNRLPDPRALGVLLEGVLDKNPDVRTLARETLLGLKEKILPDLVRLQEGSELSPELRRELGGLFASPVPIREWFIIGSWSKDSKGVEFDVASPADLDANHQVEDRVLEWRSFRGDQQFGRIFADKMFYPRDDAWLMAYAELEVEQAYEAAWRIGCNDEAVLWINGEKVFEDLTPGGWNVADGEGVVSLKEGKNLIWLKSGNMGNEWVFSLAVSQRDPRLDFLSEDTAPHLDIEAYRAHALEQPGDAVRGRDLFMDPAGVGCIKCHAVGEEGDSTVGPNLLGIGAKYQKEELIRSVLEPSNRVESSYELTLLETIDADFIDGIVRSETDSVLELINADGEVVRINKADIQDRRKSAVSMMPNGLEQGMTLEDFADLVAYLESLREGSE